MTFNKYLEELLTPQQQKELRGALDRYNVIVVKGEQGPTGKTTLTEVLRMSGYEAFEEFEVFEIELNMPLQSCTHGFAELVDADECAYDSTYEYAEVQWRRFKPLKEDLKAFGDLRIRKGLTNEDLEIILESIAIDERCKSKY